MAEAIERHDRGEARVLPVILRPCEWERAPFAKLQLMPHIDKKLTPVVSFPSPEEAMDQIARRVRKTVDEILSSRSAG